MEYVVRIRVVSQGQFKPSTHVGSGVILDDGFILTNYHVVPKRTVGCEIFHPHSQANLTFKRIVKYSVWFDLTLIEIDEKMPGVEMAHKMPAIGSNVDLIGFAWSDNLMPAIHHSAISRYFADGKTARLSIEVSKAALSGMSG